MPLLDPEQFRHHVDRFNATEPGSAEDIINLIPNAQSWDWMRQNIPLFSCPDAQMEEIYFFRWWCFRKHIVKTPVGMILTEFITPVRHAGAYNSISCALGHHIAEGRWLVDQTILDQYINFWFHSNNGKPEAKFHNYSSWLAAAVYDRYLVTAQREKLIAQLDDLVADYAAWENEKLRPDGLFWQFDVRDGMEESISGSRTDRNARPTINSYMFGNANAIAAIAAMAGRSDLAAQFKSKAAALKQLVQEKLWDPQSRFFKAQTAANGLCESREEIGFIPWCFCLPDPEHEEAWVQLTDPGGFWAPFGITTAERRSSPIPLPRCRRLRMGRRRLALRHFANAQCLGQRASPLPPAARYPARLFRRNPNLRQITALPGPALQRRCLHRRIPRRKNRRRGSKATIPAAGSTTIPPSPI